MTALQRRTRRAIKAWWKSHGGKSAVLSVRHVYPRAYVVGHAAEKCLIVARPHVDAEPHMRERDRQFGYDIIHDFDPALTTGMWCSLGYVVTPTSGVPVAIQVVA